MPVVPPLLLALVVAANPYLAEGQRLHENLRFKEAIERLQIAVQVPGSTTDERRLAHDLLARCHVALGRNDDAQVAYVALLQSDPNAPGPQNASPKILETFLAAKRRLFPDDYVRVVMKVSQGAVLVAEVHDPWEQVVRLAAVPPGEKPLPLELDDKGQASVHLPAGLLEVHGEWAVVAHGQDEVLARVSFQRRATPRRDPALADAQPVVVWQGNLPPEDEAPPPRAAWVRWGTLTAAAVAAATTAGLAWSSARDAREAEGARFASDTAALDQSARNKAVAANWTGGTAIALGLGSAFLFMAW